ncbi:MAG: hypothetical protein JWM21_624 [Acidobacteria bacterium]|nr:hypothetical protein [Acidobacteriota bacterium]
MVLSDEVVGQFRGKCPTNFSLSRRYDKLKLIGHQTDPLPSENNIRPSHSSFPRFVISQITQFPR